MRPAVGACGSARVRSVTDFASVPLLSATLTPSGSLSANCTSYSEFSVRLKRLPANTLWGRVVERAFEDRPLATDAQQRQSLPPVVVSPLPVRHRHGGVAIRIAIDSPLDPAESSVGASTWTSRAGATALADGAVDVSVFTQRILADTTSTASTSGVHEGSSEKDAQGYAPG